MIIYRIAAFKDKVQRFKITDPFLIFFLQKYENEISWEEISSADDINAYISNKLLPELKSSIDPESQSNRYLKQIDLEAEFQMNPGDPQVQQAYQIYKQDPEKAQKVILDVVNGQKQNVFERWWNYVMRDNDIYKQTPAFAYSVLKPIFDKSKANNKRSTMPLNEMAVAALYEKIKNSGGMEQFRIDKQYAKEVSIANQKTTEVVKGTNFRDGNGWIRLPSQKNDPKNFQKNVDKLITYSVPNGWCTGSGMAVPYLSKGDFYLYVVDGKAEVAIRMDGNQLGEIQGERNRAPFAYTAEIEEFLKAQGINPGDNYHYKDLMESKQLNENLRDPTKYEEFVRQIAEEPRLVDQLSRENRQDPKILQDVARAIDIGIRKKDKGHHYWHFNEVVGYYSDLPNDIRTNILPETYEYVVESVLSSIDQYMLNPKKVGQEFYRALDRTPPEILQEPTVQKKVQDTLESFLGNAPWAIYNFGDATLATFPEELLQKTKQHPVSQLIEKIKSMDEDQHPEAFIAQEWGKMPDKDDYTRYNYETRKYVFDEETYNEDMAEWQKKVVFLEGIGENDIRGIKEVQDALENAWEKYIEKDPNRYEDSLSDQKEYTDFYGEEYYDRPGAQDRIRDRADSLWYARVVDDPTELDNLPEDFRYNYFETEEEDRRSHWTTIWLDYFLKGNWDAMFTYDGKSAIKEMNDDQLHRLAQGLVSADEDIDLTKLPPEIQEMLYGYEDMLKRQEMEKALLEKGQQQFPFFEEMPQNSYTVNQLGQIVPQIQQARLKGWYRFAKTMQFLKYHVQVL